MTKKNEKGGSRAAFILPLPRSAFSVELTPFKNPTRPLCIFVFAIEPSIHALTRLGAIGRQLDYFEVTGVH
jgi:hypothetical protein